jgi:hypothetical protein
LGLSAASLSIQQSKINIHKFKEFPVFPPNVLNKLYIPNSLKNTETGFEFAIKNVVDSTSLYALGPVLLDGVEIPLESISVQAGNQTLAASEVSNQKRLAVYYGTTLTIRVAGQTLSAGEHVINLAVSSVDIGKVKFDVKDTVA